MKSISVNTDNTKKALRLCINRLMAQGKIDELLTITGYDIKTVRNTLATGSITPRMAQGIMEILDVDINLLVGERGFTPWEEEELERYNKAEKVEDNVILNKLYNVAKVTDRVKDILGAGKYSSTDVILKSIKNNTISVRMQEAFIKGLGLNWIDLCTNCEEELIEKIKQQNQIVQETKVHLIPEWNIQLNELSINGMLRHYLIQNVALQDGLQELQKLVGVYSYETIEEYIKDGKNGTQMIMALKQILGLSNIGLNQLVEEEVTIESNDNKLVQVKCGGVFREQDYEMVIELFCQSERGREQAITLDIIGRDVSMNPFYYDQVTINFNDNNRMFIKHKISNCKNKLVAINLSIGGSGNEEV